METGLGSTAFESTTNGVFVFAGRATASMMWRLLITTEREGKHG